MKALVFTEESISRLNRFGISDAWFESFLLPEGNHGLKRSVENDICYIIEDDLETDETNIVNIVLDGDNAIFASGLANALCLDRIVATSASHFFSTAQIPTSWRPYSEGDVLSLYAGTVHKGKGARLHAIKNPSGSQDLHFFARSSGTVPFSSLGRRQDVHRRARESLADAILSESRGSTEPTTTEGIVLCEKLPHGFVQGANLDEWYQKKLTNEQRRFVDLPYDGPVRLRGAAGTGKTISLVVKMLKDARKLLGDKETEHRLCFITHSQGSVDLVQAICDTLISPREFRDFMGSSCEVEIRTLYDLANQKLNFQLRDLTPVSLDGYEGRELQYEIITTALQQAWESKLVQSRFKGIDATLKERWKLACKSKDSAFVAELMNEFASVIDAENIRRGEESAEKYVRRGARAKWLLHLPNEIDRRFALEIHTIYRNELASMNALSIDEMVADFDAFLGSNAWDRERDRAGYDAVFVDELHLFTSLEKQTLQKLIKRKYDDEGRPSRPNVFMAYDIKQSPRDTFLDYFAADGSVFSQRSGLQNSDLIELNKVFRYTPQIADFLKDLDSAFPAIDVPGEWNAYVGDAELPDSMKPTLRQFETDLELLEEIFKEASKLARKIDGGGRRVAVLCVSEDAFRVYQPPVRGRFNKDVYLVDSRDATSDIRHVGKRFIFSMPEYVAGLQFDTVFLIHANQSEAPASAGIGRRRQLVSATYLGASRAESNLHLATCEGRGGPSDILSMALERGSLVET